MKKPFALNCILVNKKAIDKKHQKTNLQSENIFLKSTSLKKSMAWKVYNETISPPW